MNRQNAIVATLAASLLAVGLLSIASVAIAASPRQSLSRLRSLSLGLGQKHRTIAGSVVAVFLLVAVVGALTSYLRDSPAGTHPDDTSSSIALRPGSDGQALSRLEDYTRSLGLEEPKSDPAGGNLLPDVNTMIERLAARLETTPEDAKGWRMLGWSCFNTSRYKEAAAAYAKAVELDPNLPELKRSYEEAVAKALATQTARDGEKNGNAAAVPAREHGAVIRSMVDGLANRLESYPRDIEGWTRLMRSRVVLGDRDAATAALRKALEVFKGDDSASSKIAAAALELGLTAR